jgi:hypothetical protein
VDEDHSYGGPALPAVPPPLPGLADDPRQMILRSARAQATSFPDGPRTAAPTWLVRQLADNGMVVVLPSKPASQRLIGFPTKPPTPLLNQATTTAADPPPSLIWCSTPTAPSTLRSPALFP